MTVQLQISTHSGTYLPPYLHKKEVPLQDAQRLMRHCDPKLTSSIYTHLQLHDLAKAVEKIPSLRPEQIKQVKTGTMDVPENLTADLTKNLATESHNTSKSGKGENCISMVSENVKPCKANGLTKKSKMRVLGLEPKTYGLKGRCSTN